MAGPQIAREFQMAASLRSRAKQGMNCALGSRCGKPCASARQLRRGGWLISAAILSCLVLACQDQTGPIIKFTRVPRASEGGPDRTDAIEGRVIRARPGERIVLFAHWGTWYVQPFINQPFTAIQQDSTWRNSTHFGTQYAALLVDAKYQPSATVDSLPYGKEGVVAVAMVKGRPEFWQTWWFLLTATLASAGIVAAYFLQRTLLLSDEERRFRQAIESMPTLAFIARSDGHWTFVNRSWIEFTGLTVAQMAGSGWQTAVHPDDLSRVTEKWFGSLASGEPFEHEIRIRPAGEATYRWFLIRALALRDKHQRILKWYGAATDIEDRKRAEELQAILAHASRINTMENLVASISHELTQPITATTLNAKASLQWLRHDPPDLTKVRESTERIIEAGTFASEIIDRLRSISKRGPARRVLVAMSEVVQEMARMLSSEAIEHGVSIHTELKGDLPMVSADRVQLQQVLMNLILNGIEAMSETGGVLTVSSQSSTESNVQISVSDTGVGLPLGKIDQLFEPFFTTKPQGSGMGLPISKSIVEAHGGRIWASGNGEGGATLHFTIPTTVGTTGK